MVIHESLARERPEGVPAAAVPGGGSRVSSSSSSPDIAARRLRPAS